MERCQLVTPPASEPVSLADAKAQMRIESGFTADDALISGLVTAARLACETTLRQSFLATTWRYYADAFPWGGGYYNRTIRQMGEGPSWLPTAGGGTIQLPWCPLASVSSIQFLDFTGTLQTVSPSLYTISPGSPGRIQPVYGKVWPIPAPLVDAVQVQFTAGYDALPSPIGPQSVPVNIQLAIRMLAAHYYENREIAADIPPGILSVLSAADHGSYA